MWYVRVLAVIAVFALSTFIRAADTHAQCAPGAASGVTTTCTGATVNQNAPHGFGTGTENNVTLTSEPGATITGTLNGLFLGTNTRVTNRGIITGTINTGAAIEGITDLSNFGSIIGNGIGVNADTITKLTNFGAATISGNFDDAILANVITDLTNFGTISSVFESGVSAPTIARLENTGAITGGERGVVAGDITTLINTGDLTGINNDGVNAVSIVTVTNSGTIRSNSEKGLIVGTTLTSLTNTGTIIGDDEAIEANVLGTLINDGDIISTASDGVDVDGGLGRLVNRGTIRGGSQGVDISSGTIINEGLIEGDAAIEVDRDTAGSSTVTNAGTVRSTAGPAGTAIDFQGVGDDTLNLLPGSIIVGAINFGPGTDTLNVGNGLSIANTFGSLPESIVSNGAPFAILGNRIAVVDPTNLAAQDEILADLTGGIFSSLQNRLDGLRGVVGVTTNPRPMGIWHSSKMSDMAVDARRSAWVQAFGSARRQVSDGTAVATDQYVGGVVSGLDWMTASGARFGTFFGGSWGHVDAQFDSQETDIESAFGGFYVSKLKGSTFIDFAFTVGYTDFERERRVANNLVAGGIETAEADYDGWFVSPEVTFTRPLWSGSTRIEKSLTLRYAGLFLDGFTESGTAAPLTVDDRDVHIGVARLQFTLPNISQGADGTLKRNAFYAGIEGRAQLGDTDVDGTLLAQNITFDPGGDEEVGGIYAGINFERERPSGTTLYLNAEGIIETGGNKRASGKAGIRFRF